MTSGNHRQCRQATQRLYSVSGANENVAWFTSRQNPSANAVVLFLYVPELPLCLADCIASRRISSMIGGFS